MVVVVDIERAGGRGRILGRRTPREPGNYQEVRWTLGETGDGATVLTLNESNLPSEEAKAVSDQAWDAALQKLKDLLEA